MWPRRCWSTTRVPRSTGSRCRGSRNWMRTSASRRAGLPRGSANASGFSREFRLVKQFQNFFVAFEGRNQIRTGDTFAAGAMGPFEHATGEHKPALARRFTGFIHFVQRGFGDDDSGDFVIEPQGLFVAGQRPQADDYWDG